MIERPSCKWKRIIMNYVVRVCGGLNWLNALNERRTPTHSVFQLLLRRVLLH